MKRDSSPAVVRLRDLNERFMKPWSPLKIVTIFTAIVICVTCVVLLFIVGVCILLQFIALQCQTDVKTLLACIFGIPAFVILLGELKIVPD
jgi:hypothetical protein